ncbi:MAG: futalosine synthase [Desulfuromonadales bacterium]|nr:MAG: futalosine synthase [Desulfuromonadales bacterium]
MSLTIGHIEYANCTPIFTALRDGFDCSSYRFVRGVPAHLNRLLADGEIDVCPSSSIEYGKNPDRYLILPDLSISAVGPVKSVLLFSRMPLEDLDGSTIGMTTESDTSVNLLRVILAKFNGLSNSFERTGLLLAEALAIYPAVLLIGDGALRGAQAAPCSHVYDLGELWYRSTGLPFVFALWLLRRETAATQPGDVARLAADLVQAKQVAYGAYPAIAAEAPEREWIGRELLVDYWRTISYDLTEAHLRGLTLFFTYAVDLGVLTSVPALKLFG